MITLEEAMRLAEQDCPKLVKSDERVAVQLTNEDIEELMMLKVYKRNGLNCVDMNGTYTYLPDDLSKVDGEYIEGDFYTRIIIVETSV